VCGEIAGNPATALVLLGMGFDALSMGPAALLKVKWAVRQVSNTTMRAMAAEALRCERVDDIESVLHAIRRDIDLDRMANPSAANTRQATDCRHDRCKAF
jgi:phosphotransferase system enzyme I (PtsP)